VTPLLALLAALASAQPPSGAARDALSPADLDAARTAWTYFERNYHPATGLVSSVAGHPSTTMWDLGSSVIATVAARELGLLDREPFDRRISTLLRTLATLPLFEGELPNKAYDARTGAMTDYENRPAPRGLGVSAVDVARLASALVVLARLHPEHAGGVVHVLGRWRSCRLAAGGELQGVLVDGAGAVKAVQEGRLGYEQYAAHALATLGLDVGQARRYDRFAADAEILGLAVRHDTRDRRRFGAVDALVTEPWVLDAFEFGLDGDSAPLAARIFEVQKRRWEQTRVVTAASEDHVDRPPWFVYDGIWAAGQPWRTVTANGDDAPSLRGLSTKAAFALALLYPDDPYARVLRGAIAGASDPARGWYAGVYERGGVNRSVNANTNGVVLEALLFRVVGPLHRASAASPSGEEEGIDAPGEGADEVDVLELDGDAGGEPRVAPTGLGSADLAAIAASCEAAVTRAALGPPASGAIAQGAQPRPPPPAASDRGFRMDGTLFAGYRGIDGPITGGVATVWPWAFAFLRLGAEATPLSWRGHGQGRLLWGIGYDDWHDRTLFLHVDNWGQLRPQEGGLGARVAELNAGYRLPRLCFTSWLCAGPLVAMTAPFVGGPYLSARVNLTFGRDWFVMGGLGWTVPGVLEGPAGTPRWRVVYGLGRSTWRPGSLFVTYYDWGPSYRDRNGVLALGVNWGF